MKNAKRLVSAILSLLLVMTLIPAASFAGAEELSDQYRLSISGSYIYNLPAGTTVAELMASVYETATLKTAMGGTVDKTSQSVVSTGMVLCYTNAEYILVITGDVNCDGSASSVDYVLINQAIKGKADLSGAALAAADIDGDGDVSSADSLAIRSYVKGTLPLYSGGYLTEEEKAAAVVVDPTVSEEESSAEDSSAEDSSSADEPVSNYASIHFNNGTVETVGEGVTAVDNYAYVTAAGEYTVTGNTDNGYVHVCAGLEDKVTLVLSGVSITNTSGAALYFEQCKRATLVLDENTTSTLADGTATTLLDKGAVFANDTIEINGTGSLTVTGNRQHGIVSDDDIIIENGAVTVTGAVKDALHANDDITVNGGSLTVSAAGSDALESEGTVNINGGTLSLSCPSGTGIKAFTTYYGKGGTVNVLTSADGIKSSGDIYIENGSYQITTTDNAVKATLSTNISGGTLKVPASDTAVKGDSAVNVSGGTLELNSSNNAIKSDLSLNISGGDITVVSTGDGLKAYSLDTATATGETRTSYTYGSLNGSVSTSGCYLWTTGSVSNTAVYWFVAICDDNGAGGYTVASTYATGTAKNFTLSTGQIALLTHQDNANYAATCLIQTGDTVTYDSTTRLVTVTTGGNYLGDLSITGGNLHLTTATDAMQAGASIYINNGDTARTTSAGIGTSGDYNIYILSAGGASASFDSALGSYKAIKADDSVVIDNVDLYASTPEDTLRSDAYIEINGGDLTIYSGRDGIASAGSLLITGGSFYIKTGGGYGGTNDSVSSYKAIKGTGSISVTGGSFEINSLDDAVHSNGDCTISGGTFSIYSGDDGIHSDTTTTVSGGDITVNKCYEGVEGLTINLTGGTVRITASDDGINAAGGTDSSSTNPGGGGFRPGMGSTGGDTSKYALNIGGSAYVWVNATGDGLDSNGSLTISGGTTIVQQKGGGNTGFDADGTKLVNGGTFILVDGGDMAEYPSTSSAQYTFSTSVSGSANSLVCLKNSAGSALFVFNPVISYSRLMVSTPDLASGSTYSVYTGGSCTGTLKDGLYTGGSYSGGTLKKSITISSKVTK
ncbi:MAG: carbohydrate-binding domain-containing protein [Clostridia bacterium]|nr:carbohydrate-binding domain-containing protein [Clostridia bacterium]